MTYLTFFHLSMNSKFIKNLGDISFQWIIGYVEVDIPSTSKHSRIDYWTLVQHCCFVCIRWLTSFSFTFLTIATLASTFFILCYKVFNFYVSSFTSEFISDSSRKISLNRSGLFKPFNVASVWIIAIKAFQKIQKNALLTRRKLVKTYKVTCLLLTATLHNISVAFPQHIWYTCVKR